MLDGKVLELAGQRFGGAGELLEGIARELSAQGIERRQRKDDVFRKQVGTGFVAPRFSDQLVHTHSANCFGIPYSKARGSRSSKRELPKSPEFS